ncbi:MAG: D-alanine--D-alanine ligase family protein [Bacteroidota bacterium]
MSKSKVVILYGGKSVEHEISINSARNIFQYIDRTLFDVSLIGISKQGNWYFMKEVSGDFSNAEIVSLRLTSGRACFVDNDQSIVPDIVLPVLHGTDGEDGSIQGLLQTLDVPYAGSGVLGSAIAMSKLASKRLLQAAGIPTSRFLVYSYKELKEISFKQVKSDLGLPFMAKAANLGSSVGVVKVNDEAGFKSAVKECFTYDNIVLFEEYIRGRELECSVIGNAEVKASLPAEIVISPEYEFYTYEAKYQDPDAVELKVPAVLDDETTQQIRQLSIQAYKVLHCEDFARVDLFLTPEKKIFINEINTIPGFTNSSMFPMMWQEQGIAFTELITTILDSAMKKFQTSKRLKNDYTGG